jgi:hypothetical protein
VRSAKGPPSDRFDCQLLTSNVVIKTEAMSEWRRYLKWRILTLAAGLGIMEVCSSNEMGAPNASHLGTGDHAAEPTEAYQDQSR